MRISAKADYAVRATLELAAAPNGGPLKGERIAEAQGIPPAIFWPPEEIAIAQVMRAVEGPLAAVRGEPPEATAYAGSAEALQTVWVALRANLREVLEHVTLADVVSGQLPAPVKALADDPDAWVRR